MGYTTRNYSDLRTKYIHDEQNYWIHRQPNLLLDSPPFDLLYANIKARANSSMSRPPSDPQWGPATHRLNVIILCGKDFPINFIFGNERFLVDLILATAAKGDQIHPHQVSINRGNEDRVHHRSNRWTLLLPQRWNQFQCLGRWSLLHRRSLTSTKGR
jgi:hypothetical protein